VTNILIVKGENAKNLNAASQVLSRSGKETAEKSVKKYIE
jgi:hypothetical protein